MKRSKFTLIQVVLLSFLLACSSSESSPKAVAEKFVNAIKVQNYEEAKKYSSEETVSLLNMLTGMTNMAGTFAPGVTDSLKKKDDTKFVSVDEKIDGDNATVTYKIEKAGKDTTGNNTLNTIKLKKVKGKWLVAMSKTDMSSKGPQMPKAGADSTAVDTTKKGM